MKQLLLIGAAALLLLASCNKNEESEPQVQGAKKVSPPTLLANIEALGITRSSGVVEGADYTTGEQFYWSVGDSNTLYFISNDTVKVNYGASTVSGNTAEFTPGAGYASLTNGETYRIEAFYPASDWQADQLNPNRHNYTLPNNPQTGSNSNHLSTPMYAKHASYTASEANAMPIGMQLKHMGSVIRVVMKNESSKTLTLTSTKIKIETIYPWNPNWPGHPLSADFAFNITTEKIPNGRLRGEQETLASGVQAFGNGELFTAYLAAVFDESEMNEDSDITLTLTLNGADGKQYTSTREFKMSDLTDGNNTPLTKLKNGHSYYFKLLLNDSNLVEK